MQSIIIHQRRHRARAGNYGGTARRYHGPPRGRAARRAASTTGRRAPAIMQQPNGLLAGERARAAHPPHLRPATLSIELQILQLMPRRMDRRRRSAAGAAACLRVGHQVRTRACFS